MPAAKIAGIFICLRRESHRTVKVEDIQSRKLARRWADHLQREQLLLPEDYSSACRRDHGAHTLIRE